MRRRRRAAGPAGGRRQSRRAGAGRRRPIPRRRRHRLTTQGETPMSEIAPGAAGALHGRRIAILMESDFVEPEIHYYERRFAEEGAEVHFLTRLWGNSSLTFTEHEWRAPFTVHRDFEDVDDEELRSFSAGICPSRIGSPPLPPTDHTPH